MARKEGHHLAQYRLLRLLGTGRFSEVYLGEHSHLGSQVALKLLSTHPASDVKERFLGEARMLQHLEHPHIIRVRDFGIENEVAYLVMDYAAGGTVRTPYPEGQPLAISTVVSYVQQIANALQFVHAHGVIHRDLKPENLLLDQDGRVLLGDFGLALVVSQSAEYASTAMQGSLAYMAPEQFRGRPQIASDQYALGVIVYEWLSGTRPFHGTFAELCHAHLYVPPPPLSQLSPDIPPLIERVVLTALAKEPAQRFADVQTFATALALAQAEGSLEQLLPPRPSSSSLNHQMTDPALTGTTMPHYRIPLTLTSLIGREGLSRAISHLLIQPQVRLLTLTGPGGIGKTSLALSLAHEMQEAFTDGACFVSLTEVHETKQVIPTIAEVLVEQQTGNRPVFEVVETFLRNKHFLLVIDNFEQVVRAAPQLTDLLSTCPDLKILVTSRESLHVQGEHEFPVPPLALFSLEQRIERASLIKNDAMALFVERAQAIKPDFILTAEDAQTLAEICFHLDGLPLALELAAARIKLLPPHLLLSRLSNSLQVLTKGKQDAPARHRTLRETIKWSYDLLSEKEQQLFRRLCVFVGGCTLEAIEALYDLLGDDPTSVVDDLDSLIDKNLIKSSGQSREGVRIKLLETIREFGLECLQTRDEIQQVQQAHARYYVSWAETCCQELFGPEQLLWMDDLIQGMGNLRAVMRFVIEKSEWEMALQVAAALGPFWMLIGTSTQRLYMTEGTQFMSQALENNAAEQMTEARVLALAFSGAMQSWLGDTERGEACCREGFDVACLSSHIQGEIYALWGLTHVYFARYDLRTAYQRAQEGVTLSLQHGEACTLWGAAWTQGISYFNLGLVAVHDGHYAEGKAALRESVRLCSQSGDRIFPIWSNLLLGEIIAVEGRDEEARLLLEQSRTASSKLEMKALESEALRYMGLLAQREGNLEQADALLAESLRLAREVDDTQCLIWALIWYARVKMARQHFSDARKSLEEALETSLRRGDRATLPAGLEGMGYVVAAQDKPVWAVQLFGAAQALRETMGAPIPPIDRLEHEGQVAVVRTQLDPTTYQAAWIHGRDMTAEQVLNAQGEMRETASVAAIPTPPPALPAQAAALGLTRRELDVLRLLAQGLTNAQIAEQLVLSVVTVNSYLRSIYSKLAVSSRSAATRYALDHDLV